MTPSSIERSGGHKYVKNLTYCTSPDTMCNYSEQFSVQVKLLASIRLHQSVGSHACSNSIPFLSTMLHIPDVNNLSSQIWNFCVAVGLSLGLNIKEYMLAQGSLYLNNIGILFLHSFAGFRRGYD
jgi:hypothetical protein